MQLISLWMLNIYGRSYIAEHSNIVWIHKHITFGIHKNVSSHHWNNSSLSSMYLMTYRVYRSQNPIKYNMVNFALSLFTYPNLSAVMGTINSNEATKAWRKGTALWGSFSKCIMCNEISWIRHLLIQVRQFRPLCPYQFTSKHKQISFFLW